MICFVFKNSAQELNCIVQVATPQIQSSDKRIYETMQAAIYEFMNSRKWTNYTVAPEEKIECTLLFTISDRSVDVFTGTLQVQARRPIYKSSYNSVLLNFIDKEIKFTYQEYQALDFNELSFSSNLTSLLGYYAYLVIGLEFDSFKPKGGTVFFEKAQTIITNAQKASEPGWKAFESSSHKNRYWLIENLLNNIYGPIRECYYNYHRKGLDLMVDNLANAKTAITSGLEAIRKLNEEKPNSYLIQLFINAKSDEIVNIYSNASITEKTKIATICKSIDPTNASKYNKLTK